jgi:hypothetical protein
MMFVKIDDTVINTDQIVTIEFDPVTEKTEMPTVRMFMSDGSTQVFFAETAWKILELIGYVKL